MNVPRSSIWILAAGESPAWSRNSFAAANRIPSFDAVTASRRIVWRPTTAPRSITRWASVVYIRTCSWTCALRQMATFAAARASSSSADNRDEKGMNPAAQRAAVSEYPIAKYAARSWYFVRLSFFFHATIVTRPAGALT